MTVGLITIRELLADPEYKKYFTTVPQLPDHYTPETKPWRLLLQLKGDSTWKSKRFGTYKEAFAGFKLVLPKIQDAAINCPGLNFNPPMRTVRVKGKFHTTGKQQGQPIVKTIVWKPRLEADHLQHYWCAYCRRPSVFVVKGMAPRMINGFRLPATHVAFRCGICGSNSNLMDIRQPQMNQRWDVNRPKFYA